MLRPATPLSIMLFAAFGLLLISVLSVPIVKEIPLGTVYDYKFGVFGVCKPDGTCTNIGIGYQTPDILGDSEQSFDLPLGVRDTLPVILIVHPVAAFLTLVMFIMAATSHFHSPGHSSRYLLVLFIFLVIDFFVCLLAFLIDVLLFIPHLAFGSYLVLAATIIVLISSVVSCAMRRTMVGRKSRRKRIAENAEMSGENYYNREANKPSVLDITTQPAIPLTSGANGPTANDSLPTFATFEQTKREDPDGDERIPLTQRAPSAASRNHPLPGEAVAMHAPSRSPPPRDRYGNPLNGPNDGYGVTRGPSMESMRSRGSQYRNARGGGYGRGGYDMYGAPSRGRGGYGPPGRGGYGPRGGRGGAGLTPPPRGAYGMRGGRSPPPGYQNAPGQYDQRSAPAEAYGAYGRRPSDPYSSSQSNNASMTNASTAYDPYNSDNTNFPRAESPPPLPGGSAAPPQPPAVEMDATPSDQSQGYGQFGQIRDNDSDVAGMVDLQQGRGPGRHDTYISSEGSKYSVDDQYVPPRAQWNQGDGRSSPRAPSPLNIQARAPAELSGRDTPTQAPPRADTGAYYEDVDPRFAGPSPGAQQPPPIEPVYDDPRPERGGARSPAESERSNFTSISQRGVNPRWNPNAPPMPQHQYMQGSPHRRQAQQQQHRQDMLLDNPDFQLPGARTGGPPRRGPGMVPGSAYPGGAL